MDALQEDWDNPNSTYTPYIQSQTFNNTSKRSNVSNNPRRNYNNNDYLSWRKECNKSPEGQKSKFAENWRRANEKLKPIPSGNNVLLIKIETCKTGFLIGRNGSTIKELQEKSGARIKIGEVCDDDPYLKEVRLFGDEKAQQKCKELIDELLTKRRVSYTTGPVEKEEIFIDWDEVNKIANKARAEKWSNVPPIKKNFYIEDPEVANMSEEDVADFRRNNFNIVAQHVLGGDDEKILNPVRTFDQAFRHYPDIMREIENQGFKDPSPIQCQSWPILLSGKDLIGIAQTGTGKTLAFLLPALIHIDGQEVPRSQRNGPNVLIIAPTRELALQIETEVMKYSYKGIKSVCVYGGGNRRNQIDVVKGGVEIVIATPGRLNDLIEHKYINLKSVTFIVLDEADRMLDMGFEPQIRKVLLDIRPDRQSVMTSATWPPNVQSLASRYMCNPVQVYIGSLDLAVVHSVSQSILVVKGSEKFEYLLDFIKSLTDEDKVIVFVTRKVEADRISCDLSIAGVLCQCIHGNREQMDREQALDDLKTGAVRILIATDVASRGLDISDVTKVFNYDFPKNLEEYVHRAGRTGRAGRKGEVITLFTRHDGSYAAELIKILEEAEQPIPEDLIRMKEKHESFKKSVMGEGGRFKGKFSNRRRQGNESEF